MSGARPIDKADQRLRAMVGLVGVAGLTAVAVAVADIIGVVGDGRERPPLAAILAFILLVVVGERLYVRIRVRSALHGVSWSDAVVLIGLALLPFPWVVVATAIGMAIGKVSRRLRPTRVVFGVGKESVTALVGGLVLLGLGYSGPPDTPAALAALALAFVAMVVVDDSLFYPVIALASRTRIFDRYRENWDIRHVAALIRLAVAVTAIAAIELQPELLYVLPFLVLLAHLWHERWVRTRQERQAWQDLAAATESFTGVDLAEVLDAAVTGGARLFSADELEVELWLHTERRLVRGSADEVTFDGDPDQAPNDSMSIYAMALHGYPGRRDIGALRLRFRDQVRMSEREQAMLTSFAASLDTAVRNAAAYGKLGHASEVHAHAAAHDPLTGLTNRRELERLLREALTDPAGLDCRVALLMIDLKHFKEVNDTLGHRTGDQVLVQAAERLAEASGPRDVVTRFGGDEFAVLLRSAYRPHRVWARAEQILARLTEPVVIDGLPLVVEANAGLALAVDPDPGQESGPGSHGGDGPISGDPSRWAAELMRRADVAMYQAKRTSRSLVDYTPAGDTADRDRLALAGDLPRAVSQREFVLRFQPIVDLATGEARGAEALARWRHPTRGQLEPGMFLDLLERSNQLGEFTAAVLDDALAAADTWRAAGHDLTVSVNISARSLLDAGLPRMVLGALDAHHTRPDRLCLELTETLAISKLDIVDQVLTQLHDIGVRLALDDFGTGHSSLAVLARIPVHQLKIDRSFIGTLRRPWPATGDDRPDGHQSDGHQPDGPAPDADRLVSHPDAEAVHQARAVVRSTVQLAKALDLTVVAEGIETYAQRQLMWQLGCAFGQGHMFAPPLTTDQLLAHLARGVDNRPGRLATSMHEGDNIVHLGAIRRAASRRRGTSSG